MLQQSYSLNVEYNVLGAIREALPVLDRAKREVGIVQFVYEGTTPLDVLPYLGPDAIWDQLLHDGFIEIDADLPYTNLYATSDQIAELTDSYVRLNCNREDLIEL